MQRKSDKNVFASEKIAFKLVSLNGPYEEQHTFHRQPMC